MRTRPIDETFVERARRDSAFRAALLDEVWALIKTGETNAARGVMRTLIAADGGYARVALAARLPEKSVARMFGARGNPTLANLSAVCVALVPRRRSRGSGRRAVA
ncbi:MAG: transcriptional regulator [Alphaproteobacteria bacterium]|nr:transcriptional regulator [Alphaproteobacteria bacterium]